MKDYLKMTRSGTYGFLVAIPLLLGYEICMFISRAISDENVAVSSAVLFKRVMILLGARSGPAIYLGLGLLLIITGAIIIAFERKKDIKLKWQYFCFMILESFLYLPIFLFLVSWLTGVVVPGADTTYALTNGNGNFFTRFGLSLGAGVYEELVFRVILIGGLYLISKWILVSLVQFNEKERKLEGEIIAWMVAANIGSLIFSWVHFIGPLADDFTVAAFVFRYIAGMVLFALYAARGFGIAAWTHAIYDVAVLLFWN